jgi:hypothetical protein
MSSSSDPDQSVVPDFVLDDLDANPGLVRRWLTDSDFRASLLESDDPGAIAFQAGFSLSADTVAWIRQRVIAIGAAVLEGSVARLRILG